MSRHSCSVLGPTRSALHHFGSLLDSGAPAAGMAAIVAGTPATAGGTPTGATSGSTAVATAAPVASEGYLVARSYYFFSLSSSGGSRMGSPSDRG
eukprot:CAMPEP_0172387550 /NCGR_PEP_ID=MMETSP1061-20121228/4848_1 /TAXON_ID=37318 /ORGANISM="Pseudo-nitzschia pungens, Strain cf. pungens" /LENGTH=94 /DNA_ID=CAMNT_0013117221 /DNA_START=260 /DNA_END=544 /DNA_ORIENTATION=+